MKKGYHLEVTSWENDADHYNTTRTTYDNKEDALKDAHLCKYLFASKNRTKDADIRGVGNTHEYDWPEAKKYILDYQERFKYFSDEDLSEIPSDLSEKERNDWMIGWFQDVASEHMGSSDFYQFRVCESVELTYIPGDVTADIIEVK